MNDLRLVLASTSPRRRQLLRAAGFSFQVRPSRYHEGTAHWPAGSFAKRSALAKAREVAEQTHGPAVVVAADTVVVQGRRVFGKPKSRAQARAMLNALSGRDHEVLTGVAVIRRPDRKMIAWVERTRVRMRLIGEAELNAYLASGEWQDKAGAYGIQGRAGAFVMAVRGCYFNVVGLPLGRLAEVLGRWGVRPR
jgi:septum formation protein